MEWTVRIVGASGLGVGGWGLGVLLGDLWGPAGFVPWGLSLTIVGVLVGLVGSPALASLSMKRLESSMEAVSSASLLIGLVGFIVGLMAAAFIAAPLGRLDGWPAVVAPLLLSLALGSLGALLLVSRQQDILKFFSQGRSSRGPGDNLPQHRNRRVLMDTSAIIDGRIADVGKTGFLNSTLVIPRFVLDELRHVADSNDSLRRNRGRRGLEMLNKLQKEAEISVQILDREVREVAEVDGKLAKSLGAPIITTDYNLNKVAEIQGAKVLNINELANSLKPVVLPGEAMTLRVIQEGKETGQGVGFLDDGTMVVVEGGRRFINTHLDVLVTKVLQTAAGRLIFAQPKEP